MDNWSQSLSAGPLLGIAIAFPLWYLSGYVWGRIAARQHPFKVVGAGLMAPTVSAGYFSAMQMAAITLATAAGSVFGSHVNDSGFWLVGRLMGMDVKTTLKTWTVQQTLESLVAFVFTGLLFLVF